MARPKRTPDENTSSGAEGFDVPPAPAEPIAHESRPVESDTDEDDDGPEEKESPQVPFLETPEQRRLMREKRIAKAEEEQLRRLVRQYPVIARLVAENLSLKEQLKD